LETLKVFRNGGGSKTSIIAVGNRDIQKTSLTRGFSLVNNGSQKKGL